MKLDSLFLCTMDFFRAGGHLITGASVNYGYRICPQAHTIAGCVDGNIPTTDYGYVFANLNWLVESKINKKVHTRPDTMEIFTHYA